MRYPLVINLFGGAGCGKSTTRAGLFYLMKTAGISCEEAPEWIKGEVYSKNPYPTQDQLWVFANQFKTLNQIGKQQKVIVTDSPLLLSVIYNPRPWSDRELNHLILARFKKFRNLNIFIKRVKPYNPVGRYQNEEEAKEKDEDILKLLDLYEIPYDIVPGDEKAPGIILSKIKAILEKETNNIG